MKKIELQATQMADNEQLEILTADRAVLPENIPLAAAIDAALAKLSVPLAPPQPKN